MADERPASPSPTDTDIRGDGRRASVAADRFRSSVRRVMHLHRSSSKFAGGRGSAGAEPGVHVLHESAFLAYGHLRQDCEISITDYSTLHSRTIRMSNAEFVNAMIGPHKLSRQSWVKVRWINIGGISWDVIHTLARRHDLHPLALENILNPLGQGTRSKADYYAQHLFIRVLCHSLAQDGYLAQFTTKNNYLPDKPRSETPTLANPVEAGDDVKTSRVRTRRPMPFFGSFRSTAPDEKHSTDASQKTWSGSLLHSHVVKTSERDAAAIKLNAIKHDQRVRVEVLPLFVFLLRDGTVISLHPTPTQEFTAPIAARLRERDSGLRNSADPSLLVHSLLDLAIDRTFEVVDAYQDTLLKLERHVLMRPKMDTVRSLHILSEDLILYKRTIEPIKTLIYSLRRYDLDKCAALADAESGGNAPVKVVGFLSENAKTHLTDVHDHMDHILSSMVMFQGLTENLLNYLFNTLSYEMNVIMRRLTTVTIICLPLTLLTGYFGMNFEFMWSVKHPSHSDLIFWIIALPLVAIVTPMFMYQDLKHATRYVEKRMAVKHALADYQSRRR